MRLYHLPEKTPTIEALTGIMERLCAPDLTAAEARDLQLRLFRLMESIEAESSAPGDRKAARESQRCLVV